MRLRGDGLMKLYEPAILAIALLASVTPATSAQSQPASQARESTDAYIRRLAGAPASSAVGDIEIVDVGHHPLDTMISIAATHTSKGWHVSYACAASPGCASGQDHVVKEYDLSP